MIVTTAGRTNEIMIETAKKVASDLQLTYIPRKKLSTGKLHEMYADDLLIVGKERLEILPLHEKEPVFFHPNSAMFRLKRLQRGESDPFLEVTELNPGNSFLDCTLGLASESILASYLVGEYGIVRGVEGNRFLAYLVANGLKQWETKIPSMDDAMKRINVINENYESYLPTLADNSFDVVYFDPMFDTSIIESDGIKGVKQLAIYETISENAIKQAKRVAKKRVVLKDHWQSTRFQHFGFKVIKRPTAKFHYGYIECNDTKM
ncbi:hypothetical protein CIB95_08170 [Lottiidibacillus patelloidae]|uniref:Protein-L-IsoD(D-D) O-methyltransferase n=1 Tax=Lottiidibacillus patelloidae TaxID=2670334 RepID=A0A263BUL5_9BACI|nr:class I SAM-dependent methyltransferase [Lottiidibacillus patelloidae]OZM57424.1 hypothetical protein CIB95_08170 [Lottiidibacillus patelloidae]